MKNTYPVVLSPDEPGYLVFVPDFEINTEGDDLTEAIEMARDAIGMMGMVLEDEKKAIPAPRSVRDVPCEPGDFVTLVDVDFAAYRRAHETRAVKKNCTIPSWLNERAEAAGINFSAALQKALKMELHLAD